MTYQAASGSGARAMRELIEQMGGLNASAAALLADRQSSIIDIDTKISNAFRSDSFPVTECGAPLAGSLIPWIDSDDGSGQSREEWKAEVETNKILGRPDTQKIPVDGVCVRIGAMRCHSQGLTIKLREPVDVSRVEQILAGGNEWVDVIENSKSASIDALSPAFVSGTLRTPVGRIRQMSMGPEYITAFTVGDQLLWGAAEPLRRMLRILQEYR